MKGRDLHAIINIYTLSYTLTLYLLSATTTKCPHIRHCSVHSQTQIICENGNWTDLMFLKCYENSSTVTNLTIIRSSLKLMNLKKFYSLVYLDLSRNKIEFEQLRTPGPFGSSSFIRTKLKILNLSHNIISRLSSHSFATLVNWEMLDLSHNWLRHLHKDAFVGYNGVERLASLDLSFNKLDYTCLQALAALPNLKVLLLTGNQILSIPSFSFGGFTNLNILNLSSNTIERISDSAFIDPRTNQTNHALQTLDLSYNNITYISSSLIDSIVPLTSLILDGNLFDVLDMQILTGLTKLKTISMCYMSNLSAIMTTSYTELPNLTRILIHHNPRLAVIVDKSFTNSDQPQFVDMSFNAISKFPQQLLPWTEIPHVFIQNNPLKCDCDMLWLHNILASRSSMNSWGNMNDIRCSSPKNLQNHPVYSIHRSHLCINGEVNTHASRQLRQSLIISAVFFALTCVVSLIVIKRKALLMWAHQYFRYSRHKDDTSLNALDVSEAQDVHIMSHIENDVEKWNDLTVDT